MKVVFDTNIFVSALAIPGGRAQEALMCVVEGKDRLILSKAIIKELLNVLSRKFARDQEALARTAVFLSEISDLVHPRRKLSILKDAPDNRILECALTGKADYIITGDRAMLSLGKFRDTQIISLKAYLDLP